MSGQGRPLPVAARSAYSETMTQLDKRTTAKRARDLIGARVAKISAISDAVAAEQAEQDKIARLSRAAQERADRAARAAQDRANEAKQKAQERADEAKRKAQRVADEAKREAGKLAGSAKRATERAIADALRAGWTPTELRKLGFDVPKPTGEPRDRKADEAVSAAATDRVETAPPAALEDQPTDVVPTTQPTDSASRANQEVVA